MFASYSVPARGDTQIFVGSMSRPDFKVIICGLTEVENEQNR